MSQVIHSQWRNHQYDAKIVLYFFVNNPENVKLLSKSGMKILILSRVWLQMWLHEGTLVQWVSMSKSVCVVWDVMSLLYDWSIIRAARSSIYISALCLFRYEFSKHSIVICLFFYQMLNVSPVFIFHHIHIFQQYASLPVQFSVTFGHRGRT